MKKGIPKEVLKELDINKKNIKLHEVLVTVEEHQAKIPIPKSIRLKLDLKKGAKCQMLYDHEKKELVCKF